MPQKNHFWFLKESFSQHLNDLKKTFPYKETFVEWKGSMDVTINANKEPLFSRVNILYNEKGSLSFLNVLHT